MNSNLLRCIKNMSNSSSNSRRSSPTTTNNSNSKITTIRSRLMSLLCLISSKLKSASPTTKSRSLLLKLRSNREPSHISAVTVITAREWLTITLSPKLIKLLTTTLIRTNAKFKPTSTRPSPPTWCVNKVLKWKRPASSLTGETIRSSTPNATSALSCGSSKGKKPRFISSAVSEAGLHASAALTWGKPSKTEKLNS